MGAYGSAPRTWRRCQEVEELTRAVLPAALGTMAVEQRKVERPARANGGGAEDGGACPPCANGGRAEGQGVALDLRPNGSHGGGSPVAAADDGALVQALVVPRNHRGWGLPGGGRLPAPLPTTADGGTPGGGRLLHRGSMPSFSTAFPARGGRPAGAVPGA